MFRINKSRLGAIRSLLFVSLLVIGLAASTVTPALAGSGSFSNTGSMNVARDGQTATLLQNGEVLVTGGSNDTSGFLSSAELYNPAKGNWTFTGSLSIPRSLDEAVLLQNGEVLVAGGFDENLCCGAPPVTSAELYNPATGTFSATGSMTTGRDDFALVLLQNGEVLAAGGDQAPGSGIPSTAELYNPATGTWTATGSMTTSVSNPGFVLLQNGDVFVADIDIYHPATGTFTALNPPAPSGAGGPVGLVLNGSVLTYGGIFGGAIYNPSSNQWTTYSPPPCDMPNQNCGAGAALLNNGKMLVAGGITTVNAQPYPIHETNGLSALFDPATLTWASTQNLKKDRVGQSMTLLQNGQVLVAGGESFDKKLGALVPIANAELFTP